VGGESLSVWEHPTLTGRSGHAAFARTLATAPPLLLPANGRGVDLDGEWDKLVGAALRRGARLGDVAEPRGGQAAVVGSALQLERPAVDALHQVRSGVLKPTVIRPHSASDGISCPRCSRKQEAGSRPPRSRSAGGARRR
jgi:hypothetical protein